MLKTNFLLQLTTGGQIEITEKEYKTILDADDNASIYIARIGFMVQKRMVQIFPKEIKKQMEDRTKQVIGFLHDGSKAHKHFGEWVLDNGEVPDDKGNYHPTKLDKKYYPEIALDRVATAEEYQTIKKNNLNYYEFLGIENKIKRLNNNNFKKLI